MTDMDLLFVRGEYFENNENQEDDVRMLIEICNRIADSVTADEYNYWCARREQFFKEGADAVEATISDDIKVNGETLILNSNDIEVDGETLILNGSEA